MLRFGWGDGNDLQIFRIGFRTGENRCENIEMVKFTGFCWLEIMSREKLIFAEISFNFHNMNTKNDFVVTGL